jgi:hypothetical protein
LVRCLVLFAALSLTGCDGRITPIPTPVAKSRPPAALNEAFAEVEASPDTGGVVTLRDGAEVSLSPGAVTDKAVMTLQVVDEPPQAAAPRSLVGKAYEFGLEGTTLAGVALVKLPTPAGLTADQYDVAAYHWNGRAWERLGGRLAGGAIQFGVDSPGLFSVQARWRLADASLAVVLPSENGGAPTGSMVVVGQYRFAALPPVGGALIAAQLRLRRDGSGGSGQITGDETLDPVVAETRLLFQPNPAQPQGVIEFSYVFQPSPADLGVAPGRVGRYYATISVADALAPTRGLSPSIEYIQSLRIGIVGLEVVRPALSSEGALPLRWNVLLDSYLLAQPPATGLTLSLSSLLAEGGLGDYRISLEAQLDGRWQVVSNEVTVLLRLPVTATPLASPTAARPTGAPSAVATATPPPTPTRRATPGGAPSATPTVGPTPTPAPPTATPLPVRPDWASLFWADRYELAPGECATLRWRAENVIEVYYQGVPAMGIDERKECPQQTTSYNLKVTSTSGSTERNLRLTVRTTTAAAIEFVVNDYRIKVGECVQLRWRATGVQEVFLDDEGVGGEDGRQECPEETTSYELKVIDLNGQTSLRWLTVLVVEEDEIPIKFWAEQYSMPADVCTRLHWNVQNVREVFLDLGGQPKGVGGVGEEKICPTGRQFFKLTANAADGRTASRMVTLDAGTQDLAADYVIAQGVVHAVTGLPDVDPNTSEDQPGWRLIIDGVNPLFVGADDWNQAVISLNLELDLTDTDLADVVNWPVAPGQLVEFRARCSGADCELAPVAPFYLLLRSD